MTEKLKPCPLCSGEMKFIKTRKGSPNHHDHPDNDCLLYRMIIWPNDRAKWNTRAGWQPIETAPKDGTWVLIHIYRNDISAAHQAGVSYSTNDEKEWRGRAGLRFTCEPTHWQPLPDPPREE